jgi:hypothetical protein
MQLGSVIRPRNTITTASETSANMADQNTNSSQLTRARDKILRLENRLVEKQKCITKHKSEVHFHI